MNHVRKLKLFVFTELTYGIHEKLILFTYFFFTIGELGLRFVRFD